MDKKPMEKIDGYRWKKSGKIDGKNLGKKLGKKMEKTFKKYGWVKNDEKKADDVQNSHIGLSLELNNTRIFLVMRRNLFFQIKL